MLQEEVQQWISLNKHHKIETLAFRKSPFSSVAMPELLQQLKAHQKLKNKCPELLSHTGILYPPSLNLEQTSSEFTAAYKSEILSDECRTLVDVSGGLGIDDIAFARKLDEVTHLEQNADLQEIAQQNFATLKLNNIHSEATKSETFLDKSNKKWDVLYADPSRRNATKQRVFLLDDLVPNVLTEKENWFRVAPKILIKLSPLYDLNQALEQIKEITEIHIVALKNEVKELLLVLEKNHKKTTRIFAVNLQTPHKCFELNWGENLLPLPYSEPLSYLYAPNAAIMKSAAWGVVCKKYSLKKIHPNTHLFTSDELVSDFPGLIFKNLKEISRPKKELKNKSIQMIFRNFPENKRSLQKKYKFKTDGNQVVIFMKSFDKNWILYADKI